MQTAGINDFDMAIPALCGEKDGHRASGTRRICGEKPRSLRSGFAVRAARLREAELRFGARGAVVGEHFLVNLRLAATERPPAPRILIRHSAAFLAPQDHGGEHTPLRAANQDPREPF